MADFEKYKAAQKIRECLTEVAKGLKEQKKEKDSEWTRKIKVNLCKLGKVYDLETCASGVGNKAKWGEWLYDLCWADAEKNKKTGWDLKSVPLVVESEWGRTLWHIVADFDKLMLARSELKLMIYQDIPRMRVDEIADNLVRRVVKFRDIPKDDLFLLAGFDRDMEDFLFFEISHDPSGWTCTPVD